MGHQEVVDGLRFGQLERVVHGAALDVVRLPVCREVPVGVVPAGTVLVHAAVAVVVEPFLAKDHPVSPLAGCDRFQDARVTRVGPMRAFARHVLTNLLDRAVAVEVVGTVFIERAVAIFIHRHVPRTGPCTRPVHEVVASVRVDGGHDVERPLVDELGDLVDLAVVLHQVPDGVDAHFPALHLIAVNVGFDVHGRLGGVGTRVGVVDDHRGDVTPPVALADRYVLQELRVRLLERFHVGVEFGRVVPAVEVELHLERALGRRCRRGLGGLAGFRLPGNAG